MTALLILIALTLIGIAASHIQTAQIRDSATLLQSNQAANDADSALRFAEGGIRSGKLRDFSGTSPGLYADDAFDHAPPAYLGFDWSNGDRSLPFVSTAPGVPKQDRPGAAEAPPAARFIVERLPAAAAPGDSLDLAQYGRGAPPAVTYRITARSESGVAPVLLQSIVHGAMAIDDRDTRHRAVYQGRFEVAAAQPVDRRVSGDLLALPVPAPRDTPSLPLWSARDRLDKQSYDNGRLIASWNPATAAGIPFRWTTDRRALAADSPPGKQLCVRPADPADTAGTATTTNGPDCGQPLVDYLRGSRSQERRNGGKLPDRPHLMGEIIHSVPLFVGAPAGAFLGAAYAGFRSNHAHRPPVVYVEANDGMLHAVDADNGSERFAFVPGGVVNRLADIASGGAGPRIVADGTPQAGDVRFADGSWHTVLAAGEGGGGNTIFGLDVTDPGALRTETDLAAAALWEFSDPDLGNSLGAPAFSAIRANPGFAVFFGNGESTGAAVIYALDAQTGAVIAKLDLCARSAGACGSGPNGVAALTLVNASGMYSAPADRIYAGDLQGNLWRIDIASPDPSAWAVATIFRARDADGLAQPIVAPPAVSFVPGFPRQVGDFVLFGTGSPALDKPPGGGRYPVQSLYGVVDTGDTRVRTRADLDARILLPNAADATNRSGSASADPGDGWYMDLGFRTGTAMAAAPVLEPGGILVACLYGPAAASATDAGSAGESYLVAVDYAHGTAANGNASPLAVDLGAGLAASPTAFAMFDPASATTPPLLSLVPLSTGAVATVPIPYFGPQRTAWWRLQ